VCPIQEASCLLDFFVVPHELQMGTISSESLIGPYFVIKHKLALEANVKFRQSKPKYLVDEIDASQGSGWMLAIGTICDDEMTSFVSLSRRKVSWTRAQTSYRLRILVDAFREFMAH